MGPRLVISLDHPAQYQRGIYSAEAEGVGENVLHAFLPPGSRQKVKITRLVRNLKVDGGRQPFPLDCERAYRRLDRSRGPKRVSVVAFGSAHRNSVCAVAQYLLDRERLRRVVERRRAAMRIDVTDLARRNVRIVEGEPHRSRCLRAVGTWSRHMVRVVRRAIAGDLGVDLRAS